MSTAADHRVYEAASSNRPRLAGARMLFVLPTLGRGGAERQAMLLGRYLVQRERAVVQLVSVAHSDVSTTLVPELEAAQLPYTQFTLGVGAVQKLEQVRDVVRFAAMLRRARPDVILPYTMLPNILCGLTWRLSGAGACIWNQRDEGRSRVAPWLERRAVGQMPHFLSNSSHGARFLTEVLGVAPREVDVVHNGIELARPVRDRHEWRTALGLQPGTVMVTMVANLHHFKDHETLIAAWRRVQDTVAAPAPRPILALAGARDNRAEAIDQQIAALGLGGCIRLLGPVTDVAGLLAASDLLAFSSQSEGLPNAVLEGMAAGLPIVATDSPGIREVVGPAGEAWLARPRDADDLARLLRQAIADPEVRRDVGRRGQERVATSFSVESMGAATVDVICRLWRPRQGVAPA